MDSRISRIAALANLSAYDAQGSRDYIDGAPHIKHASLRQLYGRLLLKVFDRAKEHASIPTVLDLGAGEGSVTLPFLELGAQVVAVDISQSQIQALKDRCSQHAARLDARCQDINVTLSGEGRKYDIVVINSFLHHVPDYLGMLHQVIALTNPRGQIFSFQDPLRYDSMGRFALMFSTLSYASWRVFKGDLLGGLQRRIRRARGEYLEDSVHDNAEYHVTRNGVDQDAICALFREHRFDCELTRYFSTQSRLFQPIGSSLRLMNTFAIVAQRQD